MSKIIAILTLTALTFLPVATSPSVPLANEMEVTVLFSGLMVFNFNKAKQTYEVGILGPGDSDGHEFCIQRQGAVRQCRSDLPTSTHWTLKLSNPPGGAPVANGHGGKRRPDHPDGQNDFDWIVDLDGPEFHKKLELEPGHLKPIIELPKVQLFTMYKSLDLVRWKGKKPEDPNNLELFGFVAESIAFRVKLKKDETMVLTDDATNKPIFTVRYAPPSPVGGGAHLISISNTRYPAKETSDFKMYYHLFPGVTEAEQFNFDKNTKNPEQPFNPPIGYETCCSLVCTEVRLVNWDKPLH